MKTYIQFKDDVSFAYVNTESEISNGVIVDGSVDPKNLMFKRYINNEWVDAEKIKFVKSYDQNSVITETVETYFSSEVEGEVVPQNVGPGWKKENNEWINWNQLEKDRIEQERIDALVQEQLNQQIINSKPYPSWVYINNSWEPPVKYPEDENSYIWDEDSLSWVIWSPS